MAFEHGIKYSEVATTLVPLREVDAPTVVVGTCAIHLASDPAPVNEPVLCNSFSEYVKRFGYAGDFGKYTCEEAAYTHFILYNIKPLIIINVLDPATHIKTGTKTVSGVSNTVKVNVAAVLSTLTVKSGETNLVKGTDYTAAYDDGKLVLTIKNKNKLTGDSATLTYSEVDATKVTTADIIGGIDATTGKNKGLDCINDVYPRCGVLPGCVIAPKYSTDAEVAAVMAAKVTNIVGCFNTICAVDLDTSTVKKYSDAYTAKNANNLVDKNQIVCFPMVALGNEKYHLSTHVAAIMSRTDADNDDVPYVSPSNKSLQADSMCLADGTEILIAKDQADWLNSVGIVCGLNMNGYRLFGNRTAIYPASTDPKDNFIAVRRMMNWIANSIVVNFWSRIDMPITKRNAEAVVDSINQWLSGLIAREFLVAGECYFLADKNPVTELAAGKLVFSLSVTPPPPARQIIFEMEYNVDALSAIFS